MRIPFSEITEEGLRLNVTGHSWFPEGEVARAGDPKVSVSLTRSGERILAAGAIEVELRLACDRCLAEFVAPLKVEFNLILEVAEATESQGEQHPADLEFDPSDIEVYALDEPVVDLGDILYQQMLLALPQKVLCRADCLGICSHCGANRNLEPCSCSDSAGASPFAALGQLLKNKK